MSHFIAGHTIYEIRFCYFLLYSFIPVLSFVCLFVNLLVRFFCIHALLSNHERDHLALTSNANKSLINNSPS